MGCGDIMTVKERIVFDGIEGWEHKGITYRLAVSGNITEAPNGDLLCCWMSGSDIEPAPDNCPLYARSKDRGKTWGELRVLFPAGDMPSAGGMVRVTPDGRLIAQVSYWTDNYTRWFPHRMESADNGCTWSEAEPIDTPIMWLYPLANGEYIHITTFNEKWQ